MIMRQKNYGQSLVEFALTFPVAIFLFLGFMDVGRVIFIYSSLTNAVREATRRAIVMDYDAYETNPSAFISNLQQQVFDYSFSIQDVEDSVSVDVTITPEEIPEGTGYWYYTTVSISAEYLFDPITPFIQHLVGDGNGIPIQSRSTMMIEPGYR